MDRHAELLGLASGIAWARHANPCMKPMDFRYDAYSEAQFNEASLVPYRLKFSLPTIVSSPCSWSSLGISMKSDRWVAA